MEKPLQVLKEQAYKDMLQILFQFHDIDIDDDKINKADIYIEEAPKLLLELVSATFNDEKLSKEELESLSTPAKNYPMILLEAIIKGLTVDIDIGIDNIKNSESLEYGIYVIRNLKNIISPLVVDKALVHIGTDTKIERLEECYNKLCEIQDSAKYYSGVHKEYYSKDSWVEYEADYHQNYQEHLMGCS